MADFRLLENIFSHLLFLGLLTLCLSISQHSFNKGQRLYNEPESTPLSQTDSGQGSPAGNPSDPRTLPEGGTPPVTKSLHIDLKTSSASKEGPAQVDGSTSETSRERSPRSVGSREQAGESQGDPTSRERLSVSVTTNPLSALAEQTTVGMYHLTGTSITRSPFSLRVHHHGTKPTDAYSTRSTVPGTTQSATTPEGSGFGDDPGWIDGPGKNFVSSESTVETTKTEGENIKEQ